MKSETLIAIEKDVGIKAWQFVEIAKLLSNVTDDKTDSLHDKEDFLDMLVYEVGGIFKSKVYYKYKNGYDTDLETSFSDVLMVLLNTIRKYGYNIEDILRLGLARYTEQIWSKKRHIKNLENKND